ncbi:hypothetical protein [Pseudomonas sp. PDM20]|uniref:hypothetical protein n=1 Tax=Pseudomonas sp. PDM20 TaxID=2769254 RepID=UPI001786A1F9|nr:hypothetical protein [Pseudomonas sp. PDM20]MBD9685243.1 hypothetical protein [Pseudomonas sp. PDM20]
MKVEITWLVVDKPEGKRMPEWSRTIGVTDKGQVYVPAAMGGNEQQVVLCLAWDGTDCIEHLNHVFVPADWMAKEFPQTAEICKAILLAAQQVIREQK